MTHLESSRPVPRKTGEPPILGRAGAEVVAMIEHVLSDRRGDWRF